jgi:GH24 family phage-related lysozyme (muramidase)
VSNYTTNSNAAACARERAKQEYANLNSNIYLSKHSTTKHAIYSVIVQTGEGTGSSSSNVLLVNAADKRAASKGSSVLL